MKYAIYNSKCIFKKYLAMAINSSIAILNFDIYI
jgi:hypothetical protein